MSYSPDGSTLRGLAYHLDNFGDIDGLRLRDAEVPRPGPRQALVRVRAAALNRRDLMVLDQTYPIPSPPGVIPLSDGAGDVIAIGDQVSRIAVGDRVSATYFRRWIDGRLTLPLASEQYGSSLDGLLAEYRVIDEESLVKVPPHLSYEEAATLPCAAVTAWTALNGDRPVTAGDTVLTVGSGAVALFGLQFALLQGARVVAVTSSEEKAAHLKELGADAVANYRANPDWHTDILTLTGGRGADHVLDAVGPATLEQSARATAFDGQVALAGAFPATTPSNLSFLAGRLVTVRRLAVGSRASFEQMNRALTLHGTRPVVDRVFPFAEAKDAYLYFQQGGPVGKVVISIP